MDLRLNAMRRSIDLSVYLVFDLEARQFKFLQFLSKKYLLYHVNKSFILLYRGRKADSIVKTFSQVLESISNNVYNCNNLLDPFHAFHVSCLHSFPAAVFVYHRWVNFCETF